jgi:hypothetical protein
MFEMKMLRIFIAIFVISFCCFYHLSATGLNTILRGNVYDDSTYQPLPGAGIYILGTNIGGATNINGSYEINNIPPGKYLLKISLIGYFIQYTDSIRFYAGSIVDHDFYLTTGQMSTIETNKPKMDSIGKGTLEGILLDDNKKWLGYEACIEIQGTRLGVMCDSVGYYRIENLAPGTYTIKASGIGFFQRVIDNVEIEPNKIQNLCISMIRNTTFIIPDPIMRSTGGISGIVYDAISGIPITEANIVLDNKNIITNSESEFGSFYYDRIPPGVHSFTVTRHGYENWYISGINIKLNRIYNLDMVLYPEHNKISGNKVPNYKTALIGTIRDLGKNRGINGATIIIEGPNTRMQILNPVNPYEEKYTINNIPPGNYTVKTNLYGFYPQSTNSVIIDIGSTTICDFNLVPDSSR